MGNQYGSYVMYFVSNLLQKQNRKERYKEFGLFENDETGSEWHRQETLELLKKFCPEGYENACKYRHFIIGTSVGKNYIGIPGRFMLSEQPAQGSTGFTLWQPLRGGEWFYDDLESMCDEAAEYIYGYWIACLNAETLAISEVL